MDVTEATRRLGGHARELGVKGADRDLRDLIIETRMKLRLLASWRDTDSIDPRLRAVANDVLRELGIVETVDDPDVKDVDMVTIRPGEGEVNGETVRCHRPVPTHEDEVGEFERDRREMTNLHGTRTGHIDAEDR